MRNLINIASLLALTLVLTVSPYVKAGRIGGPAAEVGTLAPGQSVTFTVPFSLGRAVVATNGNGAGNIELYIYDTDGNVTVANGAGERRVAEMDVYRAGYFRVEVRNTGNVATTIVIATN